MDALGIFETLYTNGAFDQIRISTNHRYSLQTEEKVSYNRAPRGDPLFFEDFDNPNFDYQVNLTKGVRGKAGVFGEGNMLILDDLTDSIPKGAFSFSFKPGKKFNSTKNMALLGSDEGRLTFVKENDEICFYKDLPYKFIRVGGKATLKKG